MAAKAGAHKPEARGQRAHGRPSARSRDDGGRQAPPPLTCSAAVAVIAHYVHGRGRGHASRSLPVIERLRAEGHRVVPCAGGDAEEVLGTDPELRRVAPTLPGPRSLVDVPHRVMEDITWLRRLRPDLVITDGDAPGIIAARRLGLPTLGLGHDLVFVRSRLPRGLPTRALWSQRASVATVHLLADAAVAVHFLPTEATTPRTWLARPDRRAAPADAAGLPETPFGVAYFRDENGAGVLEALAAAGHTVLEFTDALDDGARHDARAEASVDAPTSGGRVLRRPRSRSSFAAALARAAFVVGSSGSNLLAEAVMLRRPILACHAPDDTEQELNALLVERAELGLRARLDGDAAEIVARFDALLAAGPRPMVDLERALPAASTAVAEAVAALLRRG